MMLLVLALLFGGLESMRPVELGPSPAASEVVAPMTKKVRGTRGAGNDRASGQSVDDNTTTVRARPKAQSGALPRVERDWQTLQAAVNAHFPDKASRPLLALAMAFRDLSSDTREPLHDLLGRVIDAAFLSQYRHEAGHDDAEALEAFAKAEQALRPYLQSRKRNEQWAATEWPKRAGVERASAVRKLIGRAAEARQLLAKKLERGRCAFFGSILVTDAHRYGLAHSDRQSVAEGEELAARLYEEFRRARKNLEEPPAAHVIASWVLQSTGIKRTDANNWVNAVRPV